MKFFRPPMIKLWQSPLFVPGFAFLQVIAAGCLVQLLLLPVLTPSLHYGNGILLGHDAVRYHITTLELLNNFREQGWSVLSLRPSNEGFTVFLLWFYLIFGAVPLAGLPLNALCFALSAFLVERNLRFFFPRGWSARWGALLFCMFPSSAVWYAQLHQEAIFVPGVLLLIHGLLGLFFSQSLRWQMMLSFPLGWVMVWWMRPEIMPVLVLAGTVPAVLLVWRWRVERLGWGLLLAAASLVAIPVLFPKEDVLPFRKQAERAGSEPEAGLADSNKAGRNDLTTRWQELTSPVVNSIHYTRQRFMWELPEAGSHIDEEVEFHVFSDLLFYLPRALQVAWLTPFPDMWFSPGASPGGTVQRRIVALETLLAYLGFIGIAFAFWRQPAWRLPLLALLAFACVPILIWGFVVPNVAALYRYRFAFWISVALPGLIWLARAGWLLSISVFAGEKSHEKAENIHPE